MRVWILRGGMVLLVGTLLVGTLVGAVSGCGHNPNHGINMEKARKAADQIHPPPKPGEKIIPGHGG